MQVALVPNRARRRRVGLGDDGLFSYFTNLLSPSTLYNLMDVPASALRDDIRNSLPAFAGGGQLTANQVAAYKANEAYDVYNAGGGSMSVADAAQIAAQDQDALHQYQQNNPVQLPWYENPLGWLIGGGLLLFALKD